MVAELTWLCVWFTCIVTFWETVVPGRAAGHLLQLLPPQLARALTKRGCCRYRCDDLRGVAVPQVW